MNKIPEDSGTGSGRHLQKRKGRQSLKKSILHQILPFTYSGRSLKVYPLKRVNRRCLKWKGGRGLMGGLGGKVLDTVEDKGMMLKTGK